MRLRSQKKEMDQDHGNVVWEQQLRRSSSSSSGAAQTKRNGNISMEGEEEELKNQSLLLPVFDYSGCGGGGGSVRVGIISSD
jgi:hypothetical protein